MSILTRVAGLLWFIGLLAAGATEAWAAEPTSATDPRLKQALARFPEADANGDGVLTGTEARAFQALRQEQRTGSGRPANASAAPPPTHADIAYGPDERHRLDLWLTPGPQPRPLVICIHGGGFRGGDKSSFHRNARLIGELQAAGISVAAINYRLTDGGRHPYPAAMEDGARAVQFLRHHAERYRLDAERFAATGGSAGGCMSLWLAFHDDLADSTAEDPVRRHSTRLVAAGPNGGQSSVHQPTLETWFEVPSLREHPALRPLFGLPAEGEVAWTGELDALARDASPITHLTRDDPPVYMTYGAYEPVTPETEPGVWVHHPLLGIKLKEAMDRLSIECHVEYAGGEKPRDYASQTVFLVTKLTGGGPGAVAR
jgi:acetyl esterase/lipase